MEIILQVFPITPEELPWTYKPDYQLLSFNQKEKSIGYNIIENKKKYWKINNHGWVSPIDYDTIKTKPRICIIGDSFVEAIQVNTEESFPSLLHKKLRDSIDVYAFGTGGAPLSQYLFLTKYVVDRFKPNLLIYVIIDNDFLESIYGLFPNYNQYYWTFKKENKDSWVSMPPTYDDREGFLFDFFYWLSKKSKLYGYIYNYWQRYQIIIQAKYQTEKWATNFEKISSNLKLNPNQYIADVSVESLLLHQEDIKSLSYYILNNIKQQTPTIDKIFVLNANPELVYNPSTSKVAFTNNLMKQIFQELNLKYIDLNPLFQMDYYKKHKKFEIENDGHWNEYGHQKVAEILLDSLIKGKKG